MQPTPNGAPIPPAPADVARFDAIAADIAHRLEKACAHLPSAEFRALVLDIALVKVRFDRVAGDHWKPFVEHMEALRLARDAEPS